ncbi:GAF domain-containing protein [Halobaculum sp. MBLA0147]|uniref:GAF domain-containing protein n=1 Tax=Halobaculum sp. MBLA0147 TaxID=3079934 RepID=UPI003524F011
MEATADQSTRTVLCVDSVDTVSEMETALADDPSLETILETTVAGASERLASADVDCVVTEHDLPDGTGMDVVSALRAETPQTPAVLYTETRPNEIDTSAFGDLVVEYLGRSLPDSDERLEYVVGDVITHSSQVGFLLPDNEEERLAALAEYDVEALPIRESFDRLTDLIASHFDTAVAFVGLIEEEEEDVLACHGADWDRITREDTICTHSMLEEEVMIVEDISSDKRFDANAGLHNLGIVSYAGANMTTESGEVVGQVCLIDHEPRTYDETERAELQQFADQAMETLELRQRLLDAEAELDAGTEVPAETPTGPDADDPQEVAR